MADKIVRFVLRGGLRNVFFMEDVERLPLLGAKEQVRSLVLDKLDGFVRFPAMFLKHQSYTKACFDEGNYVA